MDARAIGGADGGADVESSEMDVCETFESSYTHPFLLEKYCLLRKKKALLELPMPRRWWVRPVWENRKQESEYYTAIPLLMSGDSEYFHKYYKMSPSKFEELHALVEGPLTKQYVIREPIPSRARLAMTLRYLASGKQIQDVAMAFLGGISTANGIICDTCKLLWEVLQPICLKVRCNWSEILIKAK
ncbi:hypothetical protein V5799_015666 [Amblyomma americanum]|uniref:Uncharacterized protein n=1 Tax=Amblyomma americanum TaxID=6943 RepID=A0AAQ4F760_AMBAM